MTTTQLTYGKMITSVQENLSTNVSTINTFKVSQLCSYVSGLECFAVRLNKNVLNKTVNKIKALGFDVEIDEAFGFDWEVKIYCSI